MQQVVITGIPQQVHQPKEVVYHRKCQIGLGTTQMLFGFLIIIVETIHIIINGTSLYFTGIVCGVVFFLTGIMGYLAGKKGLKCYVIASLVLAIFSTLLSFVGIILSIVEFGYYAVTKYDYWHDDDYPKYSITLGYMMAKSIIVLIICIIEFILSIVHASYSCSDLCGCCCPRAKPTPQQPLGTIANQGPPTAYQIPAITPMTSSDNVAPYYYHDPNIQGQQMPIGSPAASYMYGGTSQQNLPCINQQDLGNVGVSNPAKQQYMNDPPPPYNANVSYSMVVASAPYLPAVDKK